MNNQMLKRIVLVSAVALLQPVTVSAQGFDDSSFDDTGTGASGGTQTQPSSTGAANDGFIDEGSFSPNSNSPSPQVAPPPPPPQNGGGSAIVPPPPPPPSNTGGQGGAVPPPPPPPPSHTGGQGGVTPPPPPPPNDNGGQTGVAPPAPDTPDPGPQIDPQIAAFETRDFGVPAQQDLRQGQFHGQTPVSIPGAKLVTTANLAQAMNGGMQMLVIDVLGSGYGLPNAQVAPALASPGSFNDRTQQQAATWLQQISGGDKNVPIVIYCSDPMCWLSYNASLRTVAAGYTNVYWYRGGLQAWEMAGLPLRPTGF